MGFRILNNITGTIIPCSISKGILKVAYDLRPPMFIPELSKLDFEWQCITWQESNIICILRNNKYTLVMRQNGTISVYYTENGAIIKSFINEDIMISKNVINYSIQETLFSINPTAVLNTNKHTLLNFVELSGWSQTDLQDINIPLDNKNRLYNICDDTGMVNLFFSEKYWNTLLSSIGKSTSKMSIEVTEYGYRYKWMDSYLDCASFTRSWDDIFNDWRCN